MTAPNRGSDRFDPNMRFEALPYQAEGGFNLPGLILVTALSLIGAILAGILAAWIGQWFYLVIFFPVAIGLVVGFCGSIGAHMGKLRNRFLAIVIGVGCGCVAVAVMHYFEFLLFLMDMEKTIPGAGNERFSLATLIQFIDQGAIAGVQIAGRPGQKAMNLGYWGSYIYWIAEAAIVAWMSAFVIASAAAAPFCSECQSWKTI